MCTWFQALSELIKDRQVIIELSDVLSSFLKVLFKFRVFVKMGFPLQ